MYQTTQWMFHMNYFLVVLHYFLYYGSSYFSIEEITLEVFLPNWQHFHFFIPNWNSSNDGLMLKSPTPGFPNNRTSELYSTLNNDCVLFLVTSHRILDLLKLIYTFFGGESKGLNKISLCRYVLLSLIMLKRKVMFWKFKYILIQIFSIHISN